MFYKLLITLISIIFTLSPSFVWLGFYLFLSPEGFWQRLVVFGVGLWFIGGLQLTLLVILIVWIGMVWNTTN